MTSQPSIIDCSGTIFITMPFPCGPVSELIPSEQEQVRIGVGVEVRATFENEYFVVEVSNWIRPGHADRNPSAWDKKVLEVLQHVWDQMVARGIVTGSRPYILKGNPLDMLPK